MKLSKRAITRGITDIFDSLTGLPIGVSVTAKKYFRKWSPESAKIRSLELDKSIASAYANAQLVHRFRLKSGEIADIKKAASWYLIGIERATEGFADVIVLQPAYKIAPEEIRKERTQEGWGTKATLTG